MLTLMKKGSWDESKIVAEEKARRYWALQRRRYRRQRLIRRFGLAALVAVASLVSAGAFLSYAPSLSFGSSPSVAQVRSFTYFRTCADARAADAAPLRRGQSGYSPHLDRDGDGIACEWSWRNWFQ